MGHARGQFAEGTEACNLTEAQQFFCTTAFGTLAHQCKQTAQRNGHKRRPRQHFQPVQVIPAGASCGHHIKGLAVGGEAFAEFKTP